MRKLPEITILSLLILLFAGQGRAQCDVENRAFKFGEKLTYEVSYNWGIMWVKAGKVTFSIDTIKIDNKNYFHFISTGTSYSFYDWFFRVRDRFTSIADVNTLLPVEFHRNTSEGNYKVDNSYLFDWKEGRIISSTKNTYKPLTVDTLEVASCVFDVLSAVYFTRTLNFSDKNPGYEITIRFIVDGEFYEIPIKYLDKETITNRDGQTYNCIKFSAKLVAGTIFKDGKEIFVWATDDKNNIPVKVEASIMVGWVKAYLTGYQGLKYKLESRIE